jgi:DNA-binding NtrC family response regulator
MLRSMTDGAVKRILIVDDDTLLLEALERGLQFHGLEVVAQGTFESARRALRSESFDALLTDVRLGAFNGLHLAVEARNMHPDMRIIVFSGFDDPVLRSEAERIGALYMVKPVTAQQLTSYLALTQK